MKFIKSDTPDAAAIYIAQTISTKISNDKKVLWLVPGGSAITVAVAASQQIHGVDSNLYISLTDERPGAVGHPESNWQQLKETGFNYLTREYYEVLHGQSTSQDTTAFAAWLERTISNVDFRIGLFGIGSDGHTAGLLPGCVSPSGEMVAFYKREEQERISVTPALFSQLDVAVIYAVGAEKKQMLEILASDAPSDLPLLNLRAAHELIVYNDQVEL